MCYVTWERLWEGSKSVREPQHEYIPSNAVKLAPDGYAVTTHRYHKPGDYVAQVVRQNEHGVTAKGHLHVVVQPRGQVARPRPLEKLAAQLKPCLLVSFEALSRSVRHVAWEKPNRRMFRRSLTRMNRLSLRGYMLTSVLSRCKHLINKAFIHQLSF